MDVRVVAEVRLGEAVLDEEGVQHPPVEVAGLEVDELPVGLPGIDDAALPGELADQAAVVRVEVGDEQVRLRDAQLVKGTSQRLLALRAVEAGVDEEIPLACDEVGVDLPQGVVGQGHDLPVEVLGEFGQHTGSS